MDPKDLETMENLITRQEQIGADVENIVRNYKKAGNDRKNKAYFEKRIKQLEDAVQEFDKNNDWLQDQDTKFKTSDYFSQNYDILIKNLIDQHLDIFKKELKVVSSVVAPTLQSDNPATRLIKRQAAMMSSLDRLLKSVDPEEEAAPSFKAKQKLWEEIQNLHFTIFESNEDPIKMGYDMTNYIKVEEKMIAVLKTAIRSKEVVAQAAHAAPSTPTLPKINIPKFDGNYANWPTFSDLFRKVVHEQSISSVQKMWYLKTNLTGEAEQLIRHLSLTEGNYSTAWTILTDRFANKRILASTLIQQMLDYPNANAEAKAIKGLHDIMQESLAALRNAEISVEDWDPLLLQLMIKKLDRHTHMLYETSLKNPRELQRVDNFLKFLEQRFQALESLGSKDKTKKDEKQNSSNKATSAAVLSTNCSVCNSKDHAIYLCKEFINMKPKLRYHWVQNNKLCINCLKSGHRARSCTARECKHCTKKHNSLLHFDTKQNESAKNETKPDANKSRQSKPSSDEANSNLTSVVAATNNTDASSSPQSKYVMLATAKVKIIAINGQACEVRAFLDPGSQINLVTQRLVNKLSLSTSQTKLTMEGVGRQTGNSNSRVNIDLQSCGGNSSLRLEAHVMPQIVSAQPSKFIDVSKWNIPKHIELADPYFYRPEKVDVLIGAEHFWHLLRPEQISLGDCLPILQNTAFGYVVAGKTEINNTAAAVCAMLTNEEEKISDLMERFWKVDDLSNEKDHMTSTEKLCETHFANTVTRDPQGRFIIRLPFSDNPSLLGNSQVQAEKRFQAIERKLRADPNLQKEYKNFMLEYEILSHMKRIRKEDIPASNYFIPHHCVLKPDSSTTKLRVVFDASAKTTSGKSLNDMLHKGPTVQSELFSILLRFRIYKFVFTADIEKMYRQILMHDEDTAYQLIVWRSNENDDFQYYKLKTVTYGTTSAPYLATKCLQHLATENKVKYPLGAAAIEKDFYVDDCISGANNITTAQGMQSQITAILKTAGFRLRKWCANNSRLLSNIPVEDQEISLDLEEASKQTIKTLGIIWLPKSDELCGKANISPVAKITKRAVSSELARIFDPLGLFGPITVRAKIFMQQLWEMKIDWDQEIPMQLQNQWAQFRGDLQVLNDLKTPRHVFCGHNPIKIQIHTFSDASERAYGAAVYLRAINKDKTIRVQLLCAKSRIAPMKKLTIPRLELCAALLGAELTARVKSDLQFNDTPTYFWSDSTIVLSWIQSSSAGLHTFVANRVTSVQQLTHAEQWHHVSSGDNPADVLSRGTSPEQLKHNSAWFYGPLFLYATKDWWVKPIAKITALPTDIERRSPRTVAIICNRESPVHRIEHRNSFKVLQNIVAYMRRPLLRVKPRHLAVSPLEKEYALKAIVKALQATEFHQEINDLKKHRAIAHSSQLNDLNPFIDAEGILRAGGRVEYSDLPYAAKHQMILPYNDPIVKLLFIYMHEENKHCSIQSLITAMRQLFWPIKCKITARNTVHNCIRCSRAKPRLMNQIMGQLPADRVNVSRPFFKSGVDYCGPFFVHYKGRGSRKTKAYLAIFCCFATKAVHLELVTDLTTDAFLGALHRFIGRRGRCQVIYCDNATNFVGANNLLKELEESIFSSSAQEKIIRESSDRGIDFKFIPPRAPHFGGLWEAAVKSAKYLLVRHVADASLTYEELETVVVGVEAILNSRPLTPMSSDPNDLSAITPGHFLIGEPLTAMPDPHQRHESIKFVQRWELVSRLKHSFWKRWAEEYLSELQQRCKWKTERYNLKENDVVIIKDDNLPTMSWPIGRVLKVYKGKDGRIRVAEVKTAKGIFKRPLTSLAPLPTAGPINSNEVQEQPQSSSTPPKTNVTSADNNDANTNKSSLMVSIPLRRLKGIDSLKEKQKPSEDANTYKRQRLSSAPSYLAMAMITLLLLPIILAAPVKQQQLSNKPGLYFEGIGTVNRIVGDWKIITYFDLAPIQVELQAFQNGTLLLETLCPRLQQDYMCFELLKHFKDMKFALEETRPTKRRIARGAFDIVGNVANKLFGVLDNEYAEEMSKQIKQLTSNDHMLAKMIQNQTSIIDTTINIVKRDAKQIMLKLNMLQKDVNTIAKDIVDVKRQINLVEIFASTAAQLTLLSNDLQRLEADIFDVLSGARHGKISPLLISPQQLQQEITKIKEHLPNSLHLPFNQADVIHMYELMSSQSGVASDHIIFIIHLPLTNNEAFNLFNILPIAATVNDTMITIQPDTKLIAVTSYLDQYFALSSEELKSCKTIKQGTNQLLCPGKQTKYHHGATEYLCEMNLLRNGTDESCILKEVRSPTSFIPLKHTNQWIFTSKHPTTISAVCNGTTQILQLQGSSLLTLQHDCTLKHDSATIQAHQIYEDNMYESHIKFGDFTQRNKSLPRIILHDSPLDLSNDLIQLKQLQATIQDDEFFELPKVVESHNIHHHITSYAALLLIVGTISCLLWKLKKPRQSRTLESNNAPSARPRFTISPELST